MKFLLESKIFRLMIFEGDKLIFVIYCNDFFCIQRTGDSLAPDFRAKRCLLFTTTSTRSSSPFCHCCRWCCRWCCCRCCCCCSASVTDSLCLDLVASNVNFQFYGLGNFYGLSISILLHWFFQNNRTKWFPVLCNGPLYPDRAFSNRLEFIINSLPLK